MDFNEEHSAFHGRTILDQAEFANNAIQYILESYGPSTTSLIVIAHSMGGIVAKTIVTLESYTAGSISTIITLATPHFLPTISVDWELDLLYSRVNEYWLDSNINNNLLSDLALVSISGGNHDSLIASDSTLVSWFLPPSNGFAVSASAIPHVWTTADHKCILWCNQLVMVIVRSLYDITDTTSSTNVAPLSRRMDLLHRAFIGTPGNFSRGVYQ